MNTNMVASELGVSAKTVQRWVKQLNLPAERNENRTLFVHGRRREGSKIRSKTNL